MKFNYAKEDLAECLGITKERESEMVDEVEIIYEKLCTEKPDGFSILEAFGAMSHIPQTAEEGFLIASTFSPFMLEQKKISERSSFIMDLIDNLSSKSADSKKTVSNQ